MANKVLLTPSDVAQRLQVNERTVTLWLRKNQLRGFKIGKEWRISESDLQAFVEAGANKRVQRPMGGSNGSTKVSDL